MIIIARRPMLLRGRLRDDPGNFSDVPGFFLAHELAHQWWGHGVAPGNYHERWLSEGSAQYAAALWVRHSLGEAPFRDVLRRMARWALSEASSGPISLGHRLGHLQGNPKVFRALVYDKGAYVLHMLRGIVGDEAFRDGMRSFQAEHRFRKASTDDLRRALELASGKDLAAYFREWVFGTTALTLRVSQQSHPVPAGYETVVQVRATGLPGPAPLQLVLGHQQGREIRRVLLSLEGGTWVIPTLSRPGRIEVNADAGLLAKVERN
jgi:aminopeptidase N